MSAFVARRLAASAVLLWLLLSATFVLVHVAPGNPVDLLLSDVRIPAAVRAREVERLGLERPLAEQYLRWLAAMVRLDWGRALDGTPALDKVVSALPATALLAAGVVAVRYGLGLVLGMLSALGRDRAIDHGIRAMTLVLFALPSFYLAYLAIEVVGVRLGWLPISGMHSDHPPATALGRGLELLHHLALPALVVGLSTCGSIVRLVRGGLLDVLGQDYIRAARARGLCEARILWCHALPNAIGPVVQSLGVSLPQVLSGMLITETIFAWPGIGRVTFQAFGARDYPVILASTALASMVVVLGSLAADLTHALIDPRVRHSHG